MVEKARRLTSVLQVRERRLALESSGKRPEPYVEISLASDLDGNVGLGLRVPHGLSSGLDILGNLVVVRGGEDREVGETVEGDGVRRSGVTGSDGVAGDGARGNRVGRLGTEEEAVTADDLHECDSVRRQRAKRNAPAAGRRGVRRTASAVKVGPLKTSRRARVWSEGCL